MMRLFRMLSGLLSAFVWGTETRERPPLDTADDPVERAARRAKVPDGELCGACDGSGVKPGRWMSPCDGLPCPMCAGRGRGGRAAGVPPERYMDWICRLPPATCSLMGIEAKASRPAEPAAAPSDLRRLFLRRGVNVRGDAQLLAAVEDVCRELDAIRAQVGERLLRDMGLASCGTPCSDESCWIGHDDDD